MANAPTRSFALEDHQVSKVVAALDDTLKKIDLVIRETKDDFLLGLVQREHAEVYRLRALFQPYPKQDGFRD